MSKTIYDCAPKIAEGLNAGNVRSLYFSLYQKFPTTLYCSSKLLSHEIMEIVQSVVPNCNTSEIIENKYVSENEPPTNNAMIWHLSNEILLVWKMEIWNMEYGICMEYGKWNLNVCNHLMYVIT